MSFCGALHPLRPLVWASRLADRCAKTVSSHALCSGSGSSALLRCPASASALERASRLADRGTKTVSSHALCSGSGSSALLRCPASASALERASRLADRGTKTVSSHALCSGSGSSALLRCPASASALGAGLASCRPLRQKLLPVSAAGRGRNFSPSRHPLRCPW